MEKTYTFVFLNGGWWLKISSIEELFHYHEHGTNEKKWLDIASNLYNSKEFGRGMQHVDAVGFAIGMYGANRGMDIATAVSDFRILAMKNQLDALDEFGEIYINCNGGYCCKTQNTTYEQFVHKKDMEFPAYTEDDISIKRFPLGKHFYVRIGSMEIRDGDKVKWDTYDEAKAFALRYVSLQKQK